MTSLTSMRSNRGAAVGLDEEGMLLMPPVAIVEEARNEEAPPNMRASARDGRLSLLVLMSISVERHFSNGCSNPNVTIEIALMTIKKSFLLRTKKPSED